MLRLLRIRCFAIIDELELEFGKGFNAITGETGAGKSILIGALNLAVGNRVRFVTSGYTYFRHVYPQVFVGNKWVTYDAAARKSFPGWETKSPLKKAWEL